NHHSGSAASRPRSRGGQTRFVHSGDVPYEVLDLRRGTQRKTRLLEQFGPAMLAPEPAPGPRLDQDQLSRCVQNLKERERTVIVMSFFDEQTSAGVAGLLGVTEANVRVIRHRAIQQLRDCMGAVA